MAVRKDACMKIKIGQRRHRHKKTASGRARWLFLFFIL
ncbi:hypothetical protein SD78_0032 [Bacillus badius]|nr:hypothetical protein SD78_0032 [Bacillus badius]